MKKKILNSFLSDNFLIFLLILLILPLIFLCLYIHPSADDYIYASWYKLPEGAHGYWAYQVWNYLSWNGRYFSTLLLTGNPLVFHSLTAYRLIPVCITVLFYISGYYLLKSLLPGLAVRKRHILSLTVTISYFNIVPSLPESLYWMAGAVTYTLAASLFFILCSMWVLYYTLPQKKGIIKTLIILLTIAVAGFNELIAFVLPVLAATLFIARYKVHSKPDYFALGMFILSASMLVFIVAAPGNKARLLQYENHYNISYALTSTLKNSVKIVIYTFKNPPVLILMLILFLNAPLISVKASIYGTVRRLVLPAVIILTAGLTVIFYFISAYNMGIEPPLRVHGFIILLILSGAFAFVVFLNTKGEIIKLPALLLKKTNRILLLLFFVFMCGSFSRKAGEEIYFTGNIMQAAYDLTQAAPAYDRALESRYNIMASSERTAECMVVPPLEVKPQSIYFTDIKPDSSHWINWGTALYFDAACIKTAR